MPPSGAHISVDRSGLGLRTLGEGMRRGMEEELRRVGLEIERAVAEEIDRRGISMSGELKKSLHSEVTVARSALRLVVATGTSYDVFVHEGTDPHFPPYDAIERYARKKLGIGPEEMEERRVAFWDDARGEPVEFTATVNKLDAVTRAIQHAIAKRGTEAQPYMQRAWEHYRSEIVRRVAGRMEREFGEAGKKDLSGVA